MSSHPHPSRGLNVFQWFGLLGAPAAWAIHLVTGYFLAEAHCERAHWATGWSPSETVLTLAAGAVAVAAEAAAAIVFLRLRQIHEDAPGPPGRQRFFAVAGLVGNILFLVAILLSGITVVATQACRQA